MRQPWESFCHFICSHLTFLSGDFIAFTRTTEVVTRIDIISLRLLDRFVAAVFFVIFFVFAFCNNRSFLRLSLYSLLFTDYCFSHYSLSLCVRRIPRAPISPKPATHHDMQLFELHCKLRILY